MAWKSKETILAEAHVQATEKFSLDVSPPPKGQAHVNVRGATAGTTDAVLVDVSTYDPAR
jgi:hypothetical protein